MNKILTRRLLPQTTMRFCASVFALTYLPVVGAEDLPGSEEPPQITRVEEDWVALIRLPDDITSAPQILNVISPDRSLNGAFGMVELNHASFPDFQEGGLQIQSWLGETMSGVAYSSETRKLFHDYDRLEYTVAMETDGTTLTFELLNGRSRTWGWFARHGINTQVPLPGATLANYDPTFSVEKTNVNVGAHRVDVLYLRQVRYHYDDGSTTTDDTMRVIHRFRDLVEDVSLADYDANPDYYNTDITE